MVTRALGLIVNENLRSAVLRYAHSSSRIWMYSSVVPAVVGRPLMRPLEDSDNPGGREPLSMTYVKGGHPLLSS